MQKITMAKTMLTALSKVEQFLAAIDTSIINQAQNSYLHYTTTQKTIEEILASIQTKQLLHNLRVKTERLLEITPHNYRRVLILAYVHQFTAKKIADVIKKTERTVFRYLRDGLRWFADRIDSVVSNYDFANIMTDEKWLRNIYNRLQENIS